MTPYYDNGGITIYHGDCLEVMAALPAQSFDAVICDPPYGTTACAWDSPIPFAPMWAAIKRLIRPRAPVALFGSQPFTSALVMSNPKWFRYSWQWDKGRGFNPQLANVQPMKSHEDICVFAQEGHTYNPQKTPLKNTLVDWRGRSSERANRKDGNGHQLFNSPRQDKVYTDRYPESIVYFPAVAQTLRLHDTEKPLALMEYLVKTYTNSGDVVLDFTCGSGTTLRACKNLGRQCVGIELLEHYCAVTARRLSPAFEEAIQATDVEDWTGTLFEVSS